MTNARTSLRRQQALELRLAGASYRQIATRLEVSLPVAWRHVQTALQESMEEPPQDVRQTELLRLDRLMMAHWPRAIGGDVAAADRVIKIMDRRARLLGLDLPPGALPVSRTSSVLDELRARRENRRSG